MTNAIIRRALVAAALVVTTHAPVAAQTEIWGLNSGFSPAEQFFTVHGAGWFVTPKTGGVINSVQTWFSPAYGADRDIVMELRTGAWGTGSLLRTATFSSSIARNSLGGGVFADFLLEAGTSYFVGFTNLDGLGGNKTHDPAGVELSSGWIMDEAGNTTEWSSEYIFNNAPILSFADTTVTPEPVSMALLGTGLVGLAAARRRRRERTLD